MKPSINPNLHAEMVESLDFIKALAAAQRAGKWGSIKTLSGPQAEAYLKEMGDLLAALPAAMEQMRQRIRVSVDQGAKSPLTNKRRKRAEREAAAKAETEQPAEAAVPQEQAA